MSTVAWVLVVLVALAAALVVYAWLEAGWLRTRVREVPVRGLPPQLDGLRVAHLSDFHLGAPLSRGRSASERAVAWVAGRRPDLVCITGDLVSHPRGEPLLRELLQRLDKPFVVLGNHDVALTRDPFSRAAELDDLREAVLLRDEAVDVQHGGARIRLVGVDPVSFRARDAAPDALADGGADLCILLCHFPDIGGYASIDRFHLVLSGHLHAGQLSLPFPHGRVALAHPRARPVAGLHVDGSGRVLHISPGTGTTFVPLRFCARPEVTELVLRAAAAPPVAARPGR
jgi:predicted MPP superfamily phosphohydrolase